MHIDETLIGEAVRTAEPGALAAALAQLTQDLSWVNDDAMSWISAVRAGSGISEQPMPACFLERAVATLTALASGHQDRIGGADDHLLLSIALKAVDASIGRDELPRLNQELGLPQRPTDLSDVPLDVMIVGAGMSGLALAKQLRDANLRVTIVEKNRGIGGSWLENRYPECGVDTPIWQYAWSQMPKLDWERLDAKRDEILRYLQEKAAEHHLLPLIRFESEVRTAQWDEGQSSWLLEVSGPSGPETVRCHVLINAVGALSRPKIPEVPGLDTFQGQSFHTARWPANVTLTGKRVAIVGNGSSGTQVARHVALEADHLLIVQRSPHWIRPRSTPESGRMPDGHRWLMKTLPAYLGWYRLYMDYCLADGQFERLRRDPDSGLPSAANSAYRDELLQYIRKELDGHPDLIRRVTPSYPPFAKRMVVDNDWYKTLRRPNVELVSSGIERATRSGLLTLDGATHALDVIIFATGFHGTRFFYPMDLIGRSGVSVFERHQGIDNLRAYLGVAIPDLPNFFSLQGPNSHQGHGGGGTFISECQSHLIISCLSLMRERGARVIECRQDAADQYNQDLDEGLSQMVWSEPGLVSRYRNDAERIVMQQPWTLREFWTRTAEARPEHFTLS